MFTLFEIIQTNLNKLQFKEHLKFFLLFCFIKTTCNNDWSTLFISLHNLIPYSFLQQRMVLMSEKFIVSYIQKKKQICIISWYIYTKMQLFTYIWIWFQPYHSIINLTLLTQLTNLPMNAIPNRCIFADFYIILQKKTREV